MQITRYVLVDADDREDDNEFDTLDAAQREARAWDCPVAIIERTYEYDDSSLVWTHDGSTSWPPDHALEQARELPGPVVTFGEDCNPDYLLGSLPLGMAVTLHLHDGPVEVMWLGCNKGVVRYKVWPGFEHGLVVNADDLPGRIIETDWINVSRIEIH